MATSHSVLCQAFLDFLHEPDLQKILQHEIDSQFEPSHIITLKDRYLVFIIALLATTNLEVSFNMLRYNKDDCFICLLTGQSCHYYRHTYMRIFDTIQSTLS